MVGAKGIEPPFRACHARALAAELRALVGPAGLAPARFQYPKLAARYLALGPMEGAARFARAPAEAQSAMLLLHHAPEDWSARQVMLLHLALIKRPFCY